MCRATFARNALPSWFPLLPQASFTTPRLLPSRLCALHTHPDGPDEAQHLAGYGGHNFLLRLALAQQVHITAMQSVTCLGCDFLYFSTQPFLALTQPSRQRWGKSLTTMPLPPLSAAGARFPVS